MPLLKCKKTIKPLKTSSKWLFFHMGNTVLKVDYKAMLHITQIKSPNK